MTVYEATEVRLAAIVREIEFLQEEASACKARIKAYRHSSMLECERIATRAEPFQTTRLPEESGERYQT